MKKLKTIYIYLKHHCLLKSVYPDIFSSNVTQSILIYLFLLIGLDWEEHLLPNNSGTKRKCEANSYSFQNVRNREIR